MSPESLHVQKFITGVDQDSYTSEHMARATRALNAMQAIEAAYPNDANRIIRDQLTMDQGLVWEIKNARNAPE